MRKINHPSVTIGCCVCLNHTGKRVTATTVVSGYAVCDDHVQLAAQPGFGISDLERRGGGRPL